MGKAAERMANTRPSVISRVTFMSEGMREAFGGGSQRGLGSQATT